MSDENLLEALRAAGHTEAADRLRDETLAHSLRQAGHDDAAALVERKFGGQPTDAARVEPSPDQAALQAQQDGQAFVDELRGALNRGKTRLPGLLDA